VPERQLSPAQQSALAVQVCAEVRQAQRPVTQVIDPQHWRLLVQAAPRS
jgi:hypothetical protein